MSKFNFKSEVFFILCFLLLLGTTVSIIKSSKLYIKADKIQTTTTGISVSAVGADIVEISQAEADANSVVKTNISSKAKTSSLLAFFFYVLSFISLIIASQKFYKKNIDSIFVKKKLLTILFGIIYIVGGGFIYTGKIKQGILIYSIVVVLFFMVFVM